jgi:hypothetical protein
VIESHVPGSPFPRSLRVSRTLFAGVPTLALGLALALAAALPSTAAAQAGAEGSGEEPLTRLLDWMFQQRSSSPGAVELYRAIRPLAPGASERLPFSGGEPGQVLIVDGFCDEACTDMDIVLYGEDGAEVGADRADDDVPIVEVPAGTYEVEVSMIDCAAPECLYGVLIVGADERAAIGAASGEGAVSSFLDLMARDRAGEGAVEIQRATGSLAPGASERFTVEGAVEGGEEGQLLSLDGACDYDCSDLNLVVYDADGEEVGADRLDDDVPIVELPAGSYEAEVSMVACTAPECAWGVVVHSGGSGGSAGSVSGEESLTRLLDWLAQEHAENRGGVELYRTIRPLAPGGSERLPFSGGEPGRVLIVDGFCDDACTDMDIVVYGADGEEAGADRMDDDVPIVEVPAGSYDVEVSMAECGAAECLYGLLIVGADEGVGDAVESGEALVDSQLDMAGRLFGGEAFGEAERWRGTLAPGGTGTVELPERASGVNAVVVAACDEDCDRLDLVLRDAAGKEVAADREDDSAPIVEAPAEAATADVLMTGCASSECRYGVVLLRSDVPASAGTIDLDGETSAILVSGLLDIIVADRTSAGAVEIHRVDGSLPAKGTERFHVEGGEPGQALVLDGVCDASCTDVDLVVYGAGGEEVCADLLDDDVPIVEVPAGSYEVEVRMVGCSAPECLYGVVVFAGVEGASEVPISGEAGTGLALDMVLDILRTMGQGEGLVEVQRTSGELAAGAGERLEVPEAGRNGRLFVAGVCDQGCTDFDLVLYDTEGNALAEDRLDDDNPMVDSPEGGVSIGVEMVACDDGPCEYSLILMAPSGEE